MTLSEIIAYGLGGGIAVCAVWIGLILFFSL